MSKIEDKIDKYLNNLEKETKWYIVKDDKGDFDTSTVADDQPYCDVHGLMNKVTEYTNGGGLWKCLREGCKAEIREIKIKKQLCQIN